MNCSTAHEAISAALDGELGASEADALDLHLDRCPACLQFREQAHDLTRRARLSAVTGAPAPDPSLVDLASAARRQARRPPVPVTARIGLVVLALVQMAVSVPALLLGTDHDAPIHVAHEMGSFDLAIAVGFLVAARRPERARGMRVIVGVVACLLMLTATVDLLAHRTGLLDEAPHLLTVAGWLLLEVLSRRAPSGSEPERRSIAGRPTQAVSLRSRSLSGLARNGLDAEGDRSARRAQTGG